MAVYVDDMPYRKPMNGRSYYRLTADTLKQLQVFVILFKEKGIPFCPCPVYPKTDKTVLWGWSGERQIGGFDYYEILSHLRYKALQHGAISVEYGKEPWRDALNKYNDDMYKMRMVAEWKVFDTSNPKRRKLVKEVQVCHEIQVTRIKVKLRRS